MQVVERALKKLQYSRTAPEIVVVGNYEVRRDVDRYEFFYIKNKGRPVYLAKYTLGVGFEIAHARKESNMYLKPKIALVKQACNRVLK